MKKLFCAFIVLIVLLCGCSQTQTFDENAVESFSYNTDYASYKDESGVKETGFVNTEKTEINNANDAVELAKKECTVQYDTIDVAFDKDMAIYRVSFYNKNMAGGSQDIYINQDGITQLSVQGE